MPPRPPQRPLHVVHIAATANGAHWMHQMLCGLRARGYQTTAIIGGRGGTLEARLTRDGIPFHVLDLDIFASRRPLAAARTMLALVTLLRRLQPDVVHYHLFPSIVLGRMAAWAADVPVRISMIPGPYYLEAPVLGGIDVRTTRFDSKVVASCEYTRTLYTRAGVPRDRIDLIYYGQDASLFDPDRADPSRVRRELGIAPGRPVVGDVAYFYPPLPDNAFTPRHLVGRGVKGHDVLLRAVPRVLAEVPDALFVLVGEGWGPGRAEYERQLRALAHTLGVEHAVRFAGPRTDVPDTLMAFDVSVQCSLNENLGGSVESLLMGRALVASDVGGLPDAVQHERTGLLVPPDDPEALGAAIARLLRDPALAARLARTGRAHALERFTLDRAVGELDALYRNERDSVMAADRRAARGYRAGRTVARLAWLGWWARRELLAPVKRALRPARPALRVVQVAGATDNAPWLVAICRHLREAGHEVTALVDVPGGRLAAALDDAGIARWMLPLSFGRSRGRMRLLISVARLPLSILHVARHLRASRAAVVHTHIFGAIVIGRLAGWLARVPCRISMVPGPLHLETPLTRALDRLTCRLDHRVIAGSRATFARYRSLGLAPPHLQYIPYGGDAQRFDPALADRAGTRAALGVADGTALVGLVAHFYPVRDDWQTPPSVRGRDVKGHDDFLAAARLVRERHPGTRFLVVGAGMGEAGEALRQRLIARTAADGLGDAVTFTGYRDDVPNLLAAIDVAVQCSLSENHGGTIESLLMERPTIATNVGGMPETVRHGDTGLLVAPSDPAALAAAICRMIEAPADAQRMARAGRTLMLAEFTTRGAAAAISAMYGDLAEARGIAVPTAAASRPAS